MICATNLSYQYPRAEKLLEFPDIELGETENLLIQGPSGVGKTTLLHLLAGLLTPHTGEITIAGCQIHELSNQKLDRFRGQQLGIVLQKNDAIHSLSVWQHLEARLLFSKTSTTFMAMQSLLSELGLTAYKNRKPSQLSQGQLQRLGIALAVVHKPRVILADEPTASLDDVNCQKVMKLLLRQSKKLKANLLVISHDQRIQSSFQKIISL